MRTTVTLDPDVAKQLRELAHSKRSSFKAVLNETLRRGFNAQEATPARLAPFKVVPHKGGFRPGLDPGKLNQILDQLDTEEFVRKSVRGR